MPMIYDRECEACGKDVAAVERLARRIERVARDAKKLGIQVFGGSGSGSLRAIGTEDGGGSQWSGNLILADISGGSWSGGDGSYGPDAAGLNRGE